MDNVSYTDPTPNNFPDDYDPSQVDSRIKLRSESLKHKEYGKDTREALYQGVEIGGAIAGEAKKTADDAKTQSQNIDDRFNDQIAGSTNDNEIIDFRHSDMLTKSFETSKLRGDFWDDEFQGRGVNPKWFGAVGDGVTDDGPAIQAAHLFANDHGLPVVYGYATYYISNAKTIPVKTDVDFNGSTIIIDETTNTWNSVYDFQNDVDDSDFPVGGVVLKKDTQQVPQFAGNGVCAYLVQNANKKDHIRAGENADQGINQQELLIADNDGNLVSPPVYDYDEITQITCYPFNKKYITFKNAHFISRGKPPLTPTAGMYYRNLVVHRNNVILENITHEIEINTADKHNQLGFIQIIHCADVVLRDIKLVTHVAPTINGIVTGDYDFYTYNVSDLKLDNVNSDMDSTHWGVMGGNAMKRVTVQNSRFSRFDSHISSYDLYFENSEFNSITISGGGALSLRNITTHDYQLVGLRQDYGSRWDGNINIENCEVDASAVADTTGATAVISGFPAYDHDYGFDELVFGKKISIKNVTIKNANTTNTLRIINIIPTAGGTGTKAKPLYLAEDIEVDGIVSDRPIKAFDGTGFNFFQSTTKHSISSTDSTQYVVELAENANWRFKNIDFKKTDYFNLGTHAYNSSLFVHKFAGDSSDDNSIVSDDYGLIPKLLFSNCENLSLDFWGYCCICAVERSEIIDAIFDKAGGGDRVKVSVIDSKIIPLEDPSAVKNALAGRIQMTSFVDVIFYTPVDINGNKLTDWSATLVYYALFGGSAIADINSNYGFYMDVRVTACRWGDVTIAWLDDTWPDFLRFGQGSVIKSQAPSDPTVHFLNDEYYNYSTGKLRKYLKDGWTDV